MEAIQCFKGGDSRVDGGNLKLKNVLYIKFDGSFGGPQKLEENDFYTNKSKDTTRKPCRTKVDFKIFGTMELNIEYLLLQQANTTTNKCNKQTHTHTSFCKHIRILQTKEALERKYKLMILTT
jgi:hypothetical protein